MDGFAMLLGSAVMSPAQPALLLLGTLAMGAAVAWLARILVAMFCRPLPTKAESWEFETARRIRLRQGSLVYRLFEPLIDELKPLRWLHRLGRIERVRKNLAAGADRLPWTPEEFLATKALEALLWGLGVGWFLGQAGGLRGGLFLGALIALGYLSLAARRLDRSAQHRIDGLKRRLPFAVDLMALMMEAGAGLREALAAVTLENRGHPLGQEFGTMLHAVERGQLLREALADLQRRLNDDDINEMAFSIIKAEELGTPMSQVFLSLADQMRLRRTQWAEKVAGEAQTKITFPGIVVMAACMIIAVAPFILGAIHEWPK